MPLDPFAKKVLDTIAAAGASDIAQLSPADMREGFRRLTQLVGANGVPIGSVEDAELPGPSGPLSIRVYTPREHAGECLPGLVYFHGGGGVFGSVETHDGLCRMLANASGCRVSSVGYRLAPEHRFPAALEDAHAAVAWAFARASALRLDPHRIAVGGDSAGGALAAAVCQRARQHGGPDIALLLLLCPALDMAAESESRRAFARGYFLDQATIDWMLSHYCPPELDRADPRLSPLHSEDLAGHPPAHIHTAEFDPLRCEGRAYADRLAAAGVAVHHRCHAGMIHHFYGMAGAIPYACAAIDEIGAAVMQTLAQR